MTSKEIDMSDYNTTKHASRCTYLQDGVYPHCDCGVRDRGIEMFAKAMGGISIEQAEEMLSTIDSVMGRLFTGRDKEEEV
jgi:hypothetical protein